MTTRNRAIARGRRRPGEGSLAYTVPADSVLLLKFIGLQLATATATQAIVWMQDRQGTTIYLADLALQRASVGRESLWTVLNDQDELHVYTSAGDVFYWCAGALLPLPT